MKKQEATGNPFEYIPGMEQATARELTSAVSYRGSYVQRMRKLGKRVTFAKARDAERNFLAGLLKKRGVAVGALAQEAAKALQQCGQEPSEVALLKKENAALTAEVATLRRIRADLQAQIDQASETHEKVRVQLHRTIGNLHERLELLERLRALEKDPAYV